MKCPTRVSTLIATLATITCFSASASAQAPASSAPGCPASHFKLESIWYNGVTKSVVSASTETKDSADRTGWILGDLCQHNDTGDVQIIDRDVPSAGRTTAVSK
jgi:hypothetical protein